MWPSPVSFWTDAGVSVDGIDALAAVLTLVLFTVVIIQLTVLTHEARRALTPAMYTRAHLLILIFKRQSRYYIQRYK